jgi:hypothetical protein
MLPFDIKYALIVGAVLLAFTTGWTVHGWKYDANLKDALQEKIELQEVYDKRARELTAKFDKQQAEQVIVYRDIKRKVPNVTDNRICFNDSDALSVWNSALTGDVPKAAAGTAKAPTNANTATNTEVLTNAVENFEQAKQIRDQLNALIDWYESVEKK